MNLKREIRSFLTFTDIVLETGKTRLAVYFLLGVLVMCVILQLYERVDFYFRMKEIEEIRALAEQKMKEWKEQEEEELYKQYLEYA